MNLYRFLLFMKVASTAFYFSIFPEPLTSITVIKCEGWKKSHVWMKWHYKMSEFVEQPMSDAGPHSYLQILDFRNTPVFYIYFQQHLKAFQCLEWNTIELKFMKITNDGTDNLFCKSGLLLHINIDFWEGAMYRLQNECQYIRGISYLQL
jgi:hypothetical protein